MRLYWVGLISVEAVWFMSKKPYRELVACRVGLFALLRLGEHRPLVMIAPCYRLGPPHCCMKSTGGNDRGYGSVVAIAVRKHAS